MSNLPVSSQSSTKGTKSRKENMRDQDRKGVESVLVSRSGWGRWMEETRVSIEAMEEGTL
jgi:hypothetical protein